jgi:pimeloyl-ACP methyl ester carboxylesterase
VATAFPLLIAPNVFGGLPTPAAPSVVNIGDASWYYWPQPGGDTCILWLGGGLESLQGGYLINPFEYESFGTIRFLQDLTKYYCLVALEKGSSPSNNYPNRSIDQEYFQGQFSIARQLHEWIIAQGYTHVFLVGYSVGTEAAASIVTTDPRTWSSSDGLILITANLSPDLVSAATGLDTNLLLIYGHAPAYEPGGERFYQLAPTETSNGTILHKEYHLLDQMGHEVWSPLRDNSYNPIALGIIVNFIQTSFVLQLNPTTFTRPLADNENYSITNVDAPARVMWGNPFQAFVTINSRNAAGNSAMVIAYDEITQRILTVAPITSNQLVSRVRLVVPPVSNTSRYSYWILVLQRERGTLVPASNQQLITGVATNQIQLQITGLAPDGNITFDRKTYKVQGDGQAQFGTSLGTHDVVIPAEVIETNVKYIFVKWSDGELSTNRTISLEDDEVLTAMYQTQYYVQVTSPIGTVSNAGWYDANSTLEPSLQSGNQQPGYLFRNWTSDSNFYGMGDPLPIESPTVIQAAWIQYPATPGSDFLSELWLSVSVFVFSLLLVVNLSLGRRKGN